MAQEPRSSGAARTAVLVHGTPLTPAVWHATAARLSSSAVVAPDCTRVPVHDPQAQLAEQIAAQVEGDVDVVGHSFGGQIGIELALLIPHRVRTLTILCSRDTPFSAFATSAENLLAGRIPPVDGSLARWFTPSELAAGGPVIGTVRRELQVASTSDWATALAAIARYDRSQITPSIRVPTTIVGAGLDRVSTTQAVTAMADRIPDSVLHIRGSWAHMSPFAQIDELTTILEASFARAS